MFAKITLAVCFALVALTCIAQGSPVPEGAAKEKRGLAPVVYSTYHAPTYYSHAPAVVAPSVYHAPVVAHAPVHGATSYSSFTINHPVYAHAPAVYAHAPAVYHAPLAAPALYSSYYH